MERPRTPSSRVRDGTAYVFIWFGFYALHTGCLRGDMNHLCGTLTAARPRPDGARLPLPSSVLATIPHSLLSSLPAPARLDQGRGHTWVSSPDGQVGTSRRQQARQPGPPALPWLVPSGAPSSSSAVCGLAGHRPAPPGPGRTGRHGPCLTPGPHPTGSAHFSTHLLPGKLTLAVWGSRGGKGAQCHPGLALRTTGI